MSAQPAEQDPFAEQSKSPALSFDGAAVGTIYTGTVTEAPKWQQTRDYNTNEPAFWPVTRAGEAPNPKMAVVIGLEVNGEARTIWAPKYPAYLFEAIQAAKKEAGGAPIAVGGTLAIQLTGEVANKDPKKHAAKTYRAKYTPPAAPDAFADTATTTVASPAAPWDAAPSTTDLPPF